MHVHMTSMMSPVEQTDLDFKISVALLGVLCLMGGGCLICGCGPGPEQARISPQSIFSLGEKPDRPILSPGKKLSSQ